MSRLVFSGDRQDVLVERAFIRLSELDEVEILSTAPGGYGVRRSIMLYSTEGEFMGGYYRIIKEDGDWVDRNFPRPDTTMYAQTLIALDRSRQSWISEKPASFEQSLEDLHGYLLRKLPLLSDEPFRREEQRI